MGQWTFRNGLGVLQELYTKLGTLVRRKFWTVADLNNSLLCDVHERVYVHVEVETGNIVILS